jgi:uncharacterized protein (UPF0332 family)
MTFNWSGYLTFAEEAMGKANEFSEPESVYRSVVSRAYYAAFGTVRNYVRDQDHQTFHGDDHRALQKYLIQHPHPPRKRLGSQLKDLHEHRLKADYRDELDELAINKAGRAIAAAKKITEGVAALKKA